MNEMKPEDVKKGLECHSLAEKSTCEDCPYCDATEPGYCGCEMAKDALALLREKDIMVERLTTLYNLQVERASMLTDNVEAYCKTASKKAIDKFVEQAKKRLPVISPSVFDQIAESIKEAQ